jgi:4-hydroxy-3-methylbut-2-enyl diphosphate reductase
MKAFNIPEHYRSNLISKVKDIRKVNDPRKNDFSPSVLDFGAVRFYLARHFGFCYGVENAIEIAYKAREENPEKRVLLLSQMIHNPHVNKDLQDMGIDFIMDTDGTQILPWEAIDKNDIVIVPAFGTTLEIEEKLRSRGVETTAYNTTCPFVERVWNKSDKLGKDNYAIVIHGKPLHEETRATFSHSKENAPSIVIRDLKEAELLADFISGKKDISSFDTYFKDRYSSDFDPAEHLDRIGVVNQTTMLATDTAAISAHLRQALIEKYGASEIQNHFADTRDTLCYATSDNQRATLALLETDADLAIVVGGYNSSNTSHLVELCETRFPTYFISSPNEIEESGTIHHFNYHQKSMIQTKNFLPQKRPLNIILTSGASCPDALVDRVLQRTLSFFENIRSREDVIQFFSSSSLS